MKGRLVISSFDEEDIFKTDVVRGVSNVENYDYKIHIRTSLEGSFEELISKPYDFDESIDFSIDVADDKSDIDFLKQIKNNRLQFLKNAEEIVFNYEPKKIAEFVKRNPILKTKRIIFEDYFDLNPKLANEISEAFGDDTSNIYFQISGNDKLITFKEYKDTVEAINKKIDEIKKYNFSPLEKIMYAYDMVRDKIYVEVDENEDKMISRNLSTALLGDKIVCLGYARVFKTLIEKLGIECDVVYLKHTDKNQGHARNRIFVKDDKYGVNGIYYFDPTWDNKKNETDTNFLYSYKHFAMTKKKMDKIDNGHIVEEGFPYFSSDIAWKFEKKVDEVGFEGITEEMRKSINHMAYLVDGSTLLISKAFLNNPLLPEAIRPNKDKIVEKLIELVEYYDTPISADILLKVLYNVRKQQYYVNPEKYPFGLNEFFKTVLISGWNFDGTPEENLMLESASTPKEKGSIIVDQIIRYSNETDMYKNMEQVKLVKTLRRVYEQKTKNNN